MGESHLIYILENYFIFILENTPTFDCILEKIYYILLYFGRVLYYILENYFIYI